MFGTGLCMNKMFRFEDLGKEVNVIAVSEPEARKKAKLTKDAVLIEVYTLNEDW